ncbi:pyridoxamine 5'-phosphate oxidase [Saccharophagus sp. K07]|jgi:pyridoxamine 5'-phosphate oxidase|uniref:pyridoxamine 5'-phosphate oxidase n=1 Tax=Saccharophagus sp. K07 TaxID=2283636 RepID=UPI0016522DBB|nr:pyridoxamine 5'-phosphate oxidase [Saccharophagus sp. K07]MBC6906726.1 pyridoxamine 5'-phosphate oxidase [Saccharophagus sp. K07]
MDLEQIRREYLLGGLRRDHLNDNPFIQFKSWLEQAVASGIPDPTALVLATVDADGQPDQRIVLLKHLDDQGFVFYTNYNSKKARDIISNPKVSLHFPWHMMERQVRVNGTASRLSAAESLKYFVSRPRDSQIAAWASQQSQRISSRQFLLEQFQRMKEKFADGKVPLPDFWGGYRVVPHRFEFWQGGGSRLHDRFEYVSTSTGDWDIGRLAP